METGGKRVLSKDEMTCCNQFLVGCIADYVVPLVLVPSVIWHCWLGVRKSIRPVKTSDVVLVWLSVWSDVPVICIWSSWCHCHPTSCASLKSRCRLNHIVLEKMTNVCLFVCLYSWLCACVYVFSVLVSIWWSFLFYIVLYLACMVL